MKLHWCCGDVYLDGYINLDVIGDIATQGKININKTTVDHYYKRPFSNKFEERERSIFVIDQQENILESWPFEDNSVEEIVMISAIEHFTKQEGLFIISEVQRVLKNNGCFFVDFPDIKKDIKLFYKKDPDFLMELLYCNGKNRLSLHKWGYTKNSFKQMWPKTYKVTKNNLVKHNYPMIGMKVEKKL